MLSADKYHLYASDPAAFRADLVIDRGGKPARLGDCLDPWQDRDFRALDPAWLCCVGRGSANPDTPRGGWLERPRGHSKSSDIATMSVWALAFAPRIVRGFAAAGDRDQAKILRDAIQTLVRLNPLLEKLIDVQNYVVKNIGDRHAGRGSELQILSSDVATSFGLLGDFFICDEPSHWSDAAEQFWVSLLSAAAKRPNALLIAILNAGWRTHWTHRVREAIRSSARWYFSHLEGCVASWINKADLAEQERLLPPSQFDRLWRNIWQDQAGDSLPSDAIAAAVCRSGPVERPIPGCQHVLTLDLGWKRDAAGLLCVAIDAVFGKLILVNRRRWNPRQIANREVCFAEILTTIRDWRRQYGATTIVADQWQAAAALQTLTSEGMVCFALPATSASKQAEAKSLLEALENRTLQLYQCGLVDDLRKATVTERPGSLGGLRIELAHDETGHGDELAALLCGLPSLLLTMREQLGNSGNGHRWGQPTASDKPPDWGTSVANTGKNFDDVDVPRSSSSNHLTPQLW